MCVIDCVHIYGYQIDVQTALLGYDKVKIITIALCKVIITKTYIMKELYDVSYPT